MSNVIYCVQGSCGEYSDRREWIVGFHLRKEDAEEHAKLAEQEAELIKELKSK